MNLKKFKVPIKELLKLKAMVGETLGTCNNEEANELLALYLEDARAFILAYTGRDSSKWLPVFDQVARELAVIAYNKRGDEGMSSKKEGALSWSYLSNGDLPKRLLRGLNRYRVIR